MENKITRDNRLDFAKGLVATFVLYAHLHPLDLHLDENSSIFLKGLAFALKQFYWQVIMIIIPAFLLVAFYITFGKLEQYGTPYLWKRLKHLLAITAFWISIQFTVYYLLVPVVKDPNYTWGIKTSLLKLLMLGGPNLPFVQGSVFYYLIILIVLTFPVFLFYITKDIKWFALVIGGAIVLGTIIYLEVRNLNGKGLPYWRVESFLVYVPLAYFLRTRSQEQLKSIAWLFFALYLIFSIQDIFLRQSGGNPGTYSRSSLIFGTTAFLSWLLTKKEDMKIPGVLSFLSVYTLGLVAIHKFWQAFIIIALTPLGLANYFHPFNLETITIAGLVTVLSIGTVYFAGRTRFRFAVA